MNQPFYQLCLETLRRELVPAMGCTEPIAIAYAAALCRATLDCLPDESKIRVSGSILKNAKSVIVPATGGRKGIGTAVAAGLLGGDAQASLEVLTNAPEDLGDRVQSYLQSHPVQVSLTDSGYIFEIDLICFAQGSSARVRIVGNHTHVVLISRDHQTLFEDMIGTDDLGELTADQLNIRDIYAFAASCRMEDVEPIIRRQIAFNTALSNEGLRRRLGACIGQILLASSDQPDVALRAKARAAADSDARMSGCELPAVINAGSGNQGITITMPIVTYAEHLGATDEELIRAMVLVNLCSIRIRNTIGCLSAYCGAVCAGCAAGAGIAYLHRYYYFGHMHMDTRRRCITMYTGWQMAERPCAGTGSASCSRKQNGEKPGTGRSEQAVREHEEIAGLRTVISVPRHRWPAEHRSMCAGEHAFAALGLENGDSVV